MTAPPIPFIGGFESTYMPLHDRDVAEQTGHTARWRQDIDLLYETGVRRLRYPVRWHRVEPRSGHFDWSSIEPILEYLDERGMTAIADLIHHTSYPRWLDDGFCDTRFRPAFLRYVRRFAERFPGIEGYQVFNEPFATLLLCAHEGLWPPYRRGMHSFVDALLNVMPAIAEGSRIARDLLPLAAHVYGDSCEHHTWSSSKGQAFAEVANDRRFFLLDLLLGHDLDPRRPFIAEIVAAGGAPLLDLEPGHVDVLGLDYYAHNQWQFSDRHDGVISAPDPLPLADVIEQYASRYDLPVVLGETNIRGYASDRATWLKYTLEQCEVAQARGVRLQGYAWFPFIDSCDWDTLLRLCRGSIDPVGVYWLDHALERRTSSMSHAYGLAAVGAPARELPAYRFQPPVSTWLEGWTRHVPHWTWEEPPPEEIATAADKDVRIALQMTI